METETSSFGFYNFIDLIKVHIVNIAALGLSLTRVEEWVRLFGMIAALVYTTLKIVQIVVEIKSSSSNKRSKPKNNAT